MAAPQLETSPPGAAPVRPAAAPIAPAGTVASAPPPPTLRSRLRYAWFALVAVLVTVPLSTIQVITHSFDPTARNFWRWGGRWGRWTLRGSGFRGVRLDETPLDPAGPYVFVANHQNLLDILVLVGYLPVPFGFVAKASLARVPFLGWAIRRSASLFVDRSTPRRAIDSLREAGERIRAGNSVLIFPEGERTFGPEMVPLMRGAFALAVEAGVPLVPVTLLDAYARMDERHHAARAGPIRFVVGEPISMEGKRRRDIPALVAEVRDRLRAPLVAHGLVVAADPARRSGAASEAFSAEGD